MIFFLLLVLFFKLKNVVKRDFYVGLKDDKQTREAEQENSSRKGGLFFCSEGD